MKNFRKIFKFAFAMVLACNIGTTFFAQTIRTVGSGGNYTTVASAFSAINNGTLTGTIKLQVISNTTETTTAALNASGTGSANYSSVAIYPTAANLTISGNLAAPLILLDGADNVTFDGRVNRTGSTVALTVENTSVSNVNKTSTFFFCNSAENNTITYCTLKGASSSRDGTGSTFNISNVDASSSGTTVTIPSSPGTSVLELGSIITRQSGTGALAAGSNYVTSIISNTQFTINQTPTTALSAATLRVETIGNGNSGGGVINFGFSIAGNGNDNNTISYCNITNSGGNRPFHGINSVGCQRNSINYSNDGLNIQNCNFYDLFRPATNTQASRNINLFNYTSNVTISGNSFYHTTPFTVTGTSTSLGYSCIFAQINFGNGNVNVTDNFIGGSAPQCGGASNMVFTAVTNQLYGVTLINLAGVGSGSTPTNSSTSTVDRNTIRKISVDYTTLATNPFFVAITTGNNTGRCHIRDNIIGSDSENNSIVISNRSSAGNYVAHGISSGSCPFGGGDSFISGNKIGGIKVDNPSDATKGRSFVAINTSAGCSNAQNLYIRKNIIGSETVANSIDLPNATGASQTILAVLQAKMEIKRSY